jgi:putative tryptophan/tyrosine transport system substrate-binding protein
VAVIPCVPQIEKVLIYPHWLGEDSMRRRAFIVGLGSAAAWPLVAWAQQPKPVIGCLVSSSAAQTSDLLIPFRQGLADAGYVDGQNVTIDYRWADNQIEHLPALALDLVRRNVAVIVAVGGGAPALAAKAATSTIPVVFMSGEDPVKNGLVASLNRPGGNLTGVAFFVIELGPKRLEVLRELLPDATRIGLLVNPSSSNLDNMAGAAALEALVGASGLQPIMVKARAEAEFESAFERLAAERAEALLVVSDVLFVTRRQQLAALAARYAIPAIYPLREYAVSGGLLSYGANVAEPFRQVGIYAGKVLSGAKPAELPVVQSTKIELIVNLNTAKALGLNVPLTLLARADEVIE